MNFDTTTGAKIVNYNKQKEISRQQKEALYKRQWEQRWEKQYNVIKDFYIRSQYSYDNEIIIRLIVRDRVKKEPENSHPLLNMDKIINELPYTDMLIELCKVYLIIFLFLFYKQLHFNELELLFLQQTIDQLGWRASDSLLEYADCMNHFIELPYFKKDRPEYKIFHNTLMHMLFIGLSVKVNSLLKALIISQFKMNDQEIGQLYKHLMKFKLFKGSENFKLAYSQWYTQNKKDIRPNFAQLNRLYKEAQNIKFGSPETNYSSIVQEIYAMTPRSGKENNLIKNFMAENSTMKELEMINNQSQGFRRVQSPKKQLGQKRNPLSLQVKHHSENNKRLCRENSQTFSPMVLQQETSQIRNLSIQQLVRKISQVPQGIGQVKNQLNDAQKQKIKQQSSKISKLSKNSNINDVIPTFLDSDEDQNQKITAQTKPPQLKIFNSIVKAPPTLRFFNSMVNNQQQETNLDNMQVPQMQNTISQFLNKDYPGQIPQMNQTNSYMLEQTPRNIFQNSTLTLFNQDYNQQAEDKQTLMQQERNEEKPHFTRQTRQKRMQKKK